MPPTACSMTDGPTQCSPGLRLLYPLCLLAATAVCGGDDPIPPDSRVASIEVTLASNFVLAGQSTQAIAAARDQDGDIVPGARISWSSTAPAVATVNADGLVTGISAGTAGIVASSDGVSGSAQISVVDAGSASLLVTAQPVAVLDGTAGSFEVALVAATGGMTGATTIVASLAGGSGNLTGTLSRETVDGAALFDDLVLRGAGPHTIAFSAPGLQPAISLPVQVLHDVQPASPWFVMSPRVIRHDRTDPVGLTVVLDGPVTRVELVPPGAPSIPLEALSASVFAVHIGQDIVFGQNYIPGDQHAFVGFLDIYKGTVRESRYSLHANIRTATMPDVPVSALSADAQQSDHALNLRWDDLRNGNGPTGAITQEAYRWLPDDFEFLAFVEQVETFRNRYFQGVRNTTPGLGLPQFDNGAQWGSAATLEGMVTFPISGLFDAGQTAMNHEIGHRWMVFLDGFASGAHWMPSDMAHGIMGFSLAGGAGGMFPFDLVDLGAAGVRLDCVPNATAFNAVELYMMGLLPRDSVQGELLILENPPAIPSCGLVHDGGVRRVTIDSLIAVAGAERPLDTVRAYRAATVVLSAGSLLTADEMAFFDAMAARGSATTELPFTSGFLRGITLPFYLATGGRATLDMRTR